MFAMLLKNGLSFTATGIVTADFTAWRMSRYVCSTCAAVCCMSVGM